MKVNLIKIWQSKSIVWIALCSFLSVLSAESEEKNSVSTRIKDIGFFDGIRKNQLIGYGIVAGLNGTGDSLKSAPFTKESLVSMLERLGVNTRNISLDTKNVAAVIVTATLPPFSRQGSQLDVSVSALGSAKSLRGGMLLVTPLYGADGQVYAVAQGSIVASGFTESKGDNQKTRGVPTSGRIANGALVEREIDYNFADQNFLRLSLRSPDFTTAKRISDTINQEIGTYSKPLDLSTIHINIPEKYKNDAVAFITRIEQLQVAPDQRAKVVINDADGIIVMGENVKVSRIALAHGSLTISVKSTKEVSQPNPFSPGKTVVTTSSNIEVEEEGKKGNTMILEEGVSLKSLVNALNAIGVNPRELIDILQSIKTAGALHADLIIQ